MLHLGKSLEDFRYEATEMGFEEIEIDIFIQEESVRQHFEKEISRLIEKRNKLLDERNTVLRGIHREHLTKIDGLISKIRQSSDQEYLLLKEEIEHEFTNKKERTRIFEQKSLMKLKEVRLEIEDREREFEIALAKISEDITTKWLVNKDKESLLTRNNETKEEMLTLANNDDQNGSSMTKKERHANKSTSKKVTHLSFT